MSVIRRTKRRGAGLALATKPPKLVAVAWPTARTAWALLTKKERQSAVAPTEGFPGGRQRLRWTSGARTEEEQGQTVMERVAALLVCHVTLARSAYRRPRPAKPPRRMNVPDAPSSSKCLHHRGASIHEAQHAVADRPFACCGEVRR